MTEHGLRASPSPSPRPSMWAATTCSWALWKRPRCFPLAIRSPTPTTNAVKGGKTPPKAATYNNGDEAAVPGITETGRRCARGRQEDRLVLHHLRLHRGRLPGRPARGLHVPHLRRPPRDVRARGAVEGAAHLPCVDLQRACKAHR